MSDATYLVLLATSRQGRATIQALQANGVKSIYGTSRNPNPTAAIPMLAADYGHPDTIVRAIRTSQATRIWFTTDWYTLPTKTRRHEFLTGKAVVDAVKECEDQVEHLVYSSVGDADKVPETVQHFRSKGDVEAYMAEQLTKTTWSVIRPVAFFDNMDDAKNYNPLTKGSVKFLTKQDIKVKFIATPDIGKGSAALLMDPQRFAGQTIEAAGGEHDGTELAAALEKVSGTPCSYRIALPRWVLWLFMGDLYHMVTWFEAEGYSADVEAFRKIVPDAMDAEAWFRSKGQWANGEGFQQSSK